MVAVSSDAARKCPTCGRFFAATERFCSRDAATLEPVTVHDARIGQVIAGRYRIQSLLSSGGMGMVYVAEQIAIGRNVAVKLLRPDKRDDDVAERRFEREVLAVSELASPHAVRIHDFGRTDEGELFMAMELLQGQTLRHRLTTGGALSLSEAREVLDQTARAVGEAHAAGVVHRDLKPENIFLARSHDYPRFVKVLDFGIAATLQVEGTKLTRDSQLPGTPMYVAPERISGDPVDPRADVYALGVIAYEMLAGSPPFAGDSSWDVFTQHLEEDPAPIGEVVPGLPAGLARLVMRSLSKVPAARPADAAAFRAQLLDDGERVVPLETAPAARRPVTDGTEDDVASSRAGRPWVAAAAIAAVIAVSAGGVAVYRGQADAQPVSPAIDVVRAGAPKPLPRLPGAPQFSASTPAAMERTTAADATAKAATAPDPAATEAAPVETPKAKPTGTPAPRPKAKAAAKGDQIPVDEFLD